MENELESLVTFFSCLKKYYSNYNIVFLSERFYDIYKMVSNNYLDANLGSVNVYDDNAEYERPILYINDLNLEMPNSLNPGDMVITYYKTFDFKPEFLKNIPDLNDEDLYRLTNYKVYSYGRFYRQLSFKHILTTPQVLDFIAREVNYLSVNGFGDGYDLVPQFLKKYYKFYEENESEIRYFVWNWYNLVTSKGIKQDSKLFKIKEYIFNDMLSKNMPVTIPFARFINSDVGYDSYLELNHEIIRNGKEKEIAK